MRMPRILLTALFRCVQRVRFIVYKALHVDIRFPLDNDPAAALRRRRQQSVCGSGARPAARGQDSRYAHIRRFCRHSPESLLTSDNLQRVKESSKFPRQHLNCALSARLLAAVWPLPFWPARSYLTNHRRGSLNMVKHDYRPPPTHSSHQSNDTSLSGLYHTRRLDLQRSGK